MPVFPVAFDTIQEIEMPEFLCPGVNVEEVDARLLRLDK
jgi:hypothetical protein